MDKQGYYITTLRIKEDAEPIDNETKFAWDDDDYEEVEVWHEFTEEELEEQARIEEESRKLEAQQAFIEQAPQAQEDIIDGLMEVGELAASNAVSADEIMEALTELAEIVAGLAETE